MKHRDIDAAAAMFDEVIRKEIEESFHSWSPLTYERMARKVADKHLNGNWGYMVKTSIGGFPPQVKIVEYLGEIDE